MPNFRVEHYLTKQSIFWDLPCLKNNLFCHNLDVMHVGKNLFDNLFNTVAEVKNKTKKLEVKDEFTIILWATEATLIGSSKQQGTYSRQKGSVRLVSGLKF